MNIFFPSGFPTYLDIEGVDLLIITNPPVCSEFFSIPYLLKKDNEMLEEMEQKLPKTVGETAFLSGVDGLQLQKNKMYLELQSSATYLFSSFQEHTVDWGNQNKTQCSLQLSTFTVFTM